MKTFATVMLAVLLPIAASADRIPIPKQVPQSFIEECGTSCHMAYPPALLRKSNWQSIMAALDDHFGDNASLDEPTRIEILRFLEKNSSNTSRYSGSYSSTVQLPRITNTAWFTRKHHEVPQVAWQHPEIKSPANCAACHTRAEQGSYREREIRLPGGIRWEDD